MSLPQFSGEKNERVFPVPSSEKKTDSQTPLPPPSHPVGDQRGLKLPELPARHESHRLRNASAPDDPKDFKRVGKMAYSWAIALLTISVTLLLTTPHPVDHPVRIVLCAASTALACLSLIAAVGLIYYSILSQPGDQLAKVQEKAMGFSAVTLVLAVLSRLALLIPFLLFLAIMPSVILFAGLLLYFAHKFKVT